MTDFFLIKMISLSKIIPLFQHFLLQTHLSTSLKPNTKQLFLLLPSVAYRLEQRIYVQSVQKWKGQDKKKKKSVILYHPRDLKIGLFWLHSTGTISNFSGKSHLMTFPKGSLTCSFLIRINGGKKSFFFLSCQDFGGYLAFLFLFWFSVKVKYLC